ncbi:c11b7859-d5e2-4ab6-b98b-a8ac3b7ea976 [Thermothielavioides terrestris]|uniref:Coronin n=1 Tax=Thermothielavioides terrestris TaxID=2587410 RepID=A0A446BUD0_9PEZI|nr:c11b7859-d5e2-4ab6-b98b-a8ac3b7ea976 [Thermothielavioides terrestris]
MAGRFVRVSKYRHVFGKPTKKEFCYDNLHISRNAWDTNLVKANPEYLAVNWEASGGGAFAVIPLNERGKLPDQIPLFRGHTAAVLDTDWNPFNDRIIASASDDGKVFIWEVPQGFTLYTDAEEVPAVSPVSRLPGHSRKVGHVLFNPAAEHILASSSGDLTLKLWDISTGQAAITLRHPEIVQSLSWSANGSMLVTTSRDKKLRVWDVRQEKPVHEYPGHEGAKNSRAVWMGEHNRIATTGFSRMSERQIGLWEPGRKDPIGGFISIDSISGVCMPFWDDGSNCLYLAGKGDGNIRYYEYENDKFEYLSEYKSADPQRGIAFLPRRGINVHENEVMRAYKTVNDTYIEPISFTVPRRAETFQADIYPPAIGLKPAMSAKEWLDGKTAVPPKIDLESVYEGTAPVEVPADYKPPPLRQLLRPPPPQPRRRNLSRPRLRPRSDDVEEEADDDAETSSFEEIGRPAPRTTVPVRTAAKPQPVNTTAPPAQAKPASPVKSPQATSAPVARAAPAAAPTAAPAAAPPAAAAPSSPAVEASLEQIKQLLEQQAQVISAQNDKLTAQTQIITRLAAEVESLKKRVGAGTQDQSERIRQLELELEAARS